MGGLSVVELLKNTTARQPYLGEETMQSPTYRQKAKFYWVGLVNNNHWKFKFLKFSAVLSVLEKTSIAHLGDAFAEIKEYWDARNEETKEGKTDSDVHYFFAKFDGLLIEFLHLF